MTIDGSGDVGINDIDPDTRLSVNSGTTDVVAKFTSSDANAWIQFRDNTTTDTAVMVGANGDDLLFRAGSNTRARISAGGSFGIGDASPTKPLTVGTTTPVILLDDQSSRTLEIRGPSTTHSATVLTTSTHDLLLGTNDTERVRITSGGNVGINSTSPGALFTVNTGGTEDAFRVGSPSGSDTIFRLGSTGTDTDTHAVIKYDKDDNYLSLLGSGESHGVGGVLIANGGNVGLGSAIPAQALDVQSGSNQTARIQAHGFIARNNWGTHTSIGNGMFSPATNALAFATNSNERLRIDSSGNVIIQNSTSGGLYLKGIDGNGS